MRWWHSLLTCFAGNWLALYALLPVAIAILLSQSRSADPNQRGNWRDFMALIVLGLAVDLRWFESAWPTGLTAIGKILLLDAGIFGFLAVRQLDGVGFDLRLKGARRRCRAARVSSLCADCHLLGLSIRFLHFHAVLAAAPSPPSLTSSRFSLSPSPRSCFFADGFRISWSGESAAPRRWWRRRSSSACRTGTSAPRASTGGMFCWLRWPGSSMAERGVHSDASALRRHPCDSRYLVVAVVR